jgi:hypothetical protein
VENCGSAGDARMSFGREEMLDDGRKYESFIVLREFLGVHLLEILQNLKSGNGLTYPRACIIVGTI